MARWFERKTAKTIGNFPLTDSTLDPDHRSLTPLKGARAWVTFLASAFDLDRKRSITSVLDAQTALS